MYEYCIVWSSNTFWLLFFFSLLWKGRKYEHSYKILFMYSYSYKYYIYTVHTPINIIYTVYSYKYYIYTNIIINIIYVYTPINIIYTVYSYKYYTYYLLSDFSHCPGLRRADISALYPKNIYLYRILSNLVSSLISRTFTVESRNLKGKRH